MKQSNASTNKLSAQIFLILLLSKLQCWHCTLVGTDLFSLRIVFSKFVILQYIFYFDLHLILCALFMLLFAFSSGEKSSKCCDKCCSEDRSNRSECDSTVRSTSPQSLSPHHQTWKWHQKWRHGFLQRKRF